MVTSVSQSIYVQLFGDTHLVKTSPPSTSSSIVLTIISPAHHDDPATVSDPHASGTSLISNTSSPPFMMSSWRSTGCTTLTPFNVKLFTYGFVAAPVDVITSGRAALGKRIVTLSKKGLVNQIQVYVS